MNSELVLGPPGCGKTTALLSVMEEELARGTRPDRIGFVSFTRRAAQEAVERACEKFGLKRDDFPWFRTIHSLCFRWLGMRAEEVLEGAAVRDFAVWSGIEVTGRWAEDGSFAGYTRGDRILHMEHLARVTCRPLRDLYCENDDDLPWSEVERVDRWLRAYKAARGMSDYSDMLQRFIQRDVAPKLDVLLVDEFQDTSPLAHRVVARLARDCRRVVYAGDDDQAIYRWAGADISPMLGMACPVRVLGQSHRVPRSVQAVAGGIVGKVHERRAKEWRARDVEGSVEFVDDVASADLSGDDVLVLARNTYVLQDFVVPELRARGIYFTWRGRGAVADDVIRDVRSWEQLRAGKKITLEEARYVYARMSSGRGYVRGSGGLSQFGEDQALEIGIDELEQRGGLTTRAVWHEALDRLPRDEVTYLLAARHNGERVLGKPRVRLSTIHGIKGGEARSVILLTEMAARTQREFEVHPEDEHRVFYVGVTRTQERLQIVAPSGGRRGYEI